MFQLDDLTYYLLVNKTDSIQEKIAFALLRIIRAWSMLLSFVRPVKAIQDCSSTQSIVINAVNFHLVLELFYDKTKVQIHSFVDYRN